MTTKVYVEAAGCDRRRLDAETMKTYLTANGYALVDDPRYADKILAVSCAFKAKEENETVRRINSLRAYGKDIVVYGCLADISADRYAEEFGDLPSVSPKNIEDIDAHFKVDVPFSEVPQANIINRAENRMVRMRRRAESRTLPVQEVVDRWRKFESSSWPQPPSDNGTAFQLFIARGCMGACSYCGIRRAIGPVRSKPADEVLAELRRGLEQGYRTFNVLADDPGCYGVDLGTNLPTLLAALTSEAERFTAEQSAEDGDGHTTADPVRFNLREIHPKYLVDYTQDLLDIPTLSLLGTLLCPVQSGSDRVLDLMQREHQAGDLLGSVQALTQRWPELRLETQMIVGFPTETDAEFEETLAFVRDGGFHSVVVFPYDDKQGTAASAIAEKVADTVIGQRMHAAFRFFHQERIPAFYACP